METAPETIAAMPVVIGVVGAAGEGRPTQTQVQIQTRLFRSGGYLAC